MCLASNEEFWQWLMARKAETESRMLRAGQNSNSWMLLKSDRAELRVVIAAYDRIVRQGVVTKAD